MYNKKGNVHMHVTLQHVCITTAAVEKR